ncbi:hypothetical protein C8J56DRAFT_802360, partial [Mycena floridula]
GAIIGDSFALQFFAQSEFRSSDLDVYVSLGRAELLIEFCMHAGYRDCPRPREREKKDMMVCCLAASFRCLTVCYARSIKGVINLFNEGGKKMQIIIVQKTPTDAILLYHSTAVMNFITGSRAYSLYPYETFVCERNLVTGRLRDRFMPLMAISKYEQRGYSSVTVFDPRV